MDTVLITGGTGYIGSHVGLSLLKNGYRIINEELFNTSQEYKSKINNMINELSKPSLELNDYIKLKEFGFEELDISLNE